ncbi:MAG TPA: M56 family metallopeptidase, partial [Myxococcales bacterium]|nr:M56 family metallopeptidase [Myxococcales bacterium]
MERSLILWGVKGAIVIGAGLLLAQAMSRASAAARHLVLCASIAAALALPLIGAILPAVGVEMPAWAAMLGASRTALSGARRPQAIEERQPSPAAPAAPVPNADSRSPRTSAKESATGIARRTQSELPREADASRASFVTADWVRFALLLWASAALALLSRAGWGWAHLAKAARTAQPVVDSAWRQLLGDLVLEMRIARRVKLLQGDEPGVPVTWGVLRPCILLPADASTWPQAQRRAVLLHELAHVERLDALTQLGASISCALHWPNPLAWLAARRMHLLRERACDDRVLSAGARPSDYATSLLDIARSVHRSRGPAAALAMARKSQLEGRLVAVLDPSARRSR